jgi:cobyrinic acid a,c-diamide synthase
LLVVDVAMATRTLAAVVKGCQVFDSDLEIAGVILNRVAGKRQEALIRDAVEKYCALPVVGAMPRVKQNIFPERHMGLVPHQERGHARKAVERTKRMVRQNIELDRILNIAREAGEIQGPAESAEPKQALQAAKTALRIGFIRDKSFWFYYPENLETLARLGADLVELDALENATLPQLDALYIGGGFPEIQARALSENRSFRGSLRAEIEAGLPVYAECGGFMYLGENLVVGGRKYPMVGALPVEFGLHSKPQGHGYTLLEVTDPNPYYAPGESIRGHEFHYSQARVKEQADLRFVFRVLRGYGVDGERDGLCRRNLLATYTHIHAAGTPGWAENFLRAAADGNRKSKIF